MEKKGEALEKKEKRFYQKTKQKKERKKRVCEK